MTFCMWFRGRRVRSYGAARDRRAPRAPTSVRVTPSGGGAGSKAPPSTSGSIDAVGPDDVAVLDRDLRDVHRVLHRPEHRAPEPVLEIGAVYDPTIEGAPRAPRAQSIGLRVPGSITVNPIDRAGLHCGCRRRLGDIGPGCPSGHEAEFRRSSRSKTGHALRRAGSPAQPPVPGPAAAPPAAPSAPPS